MGLTLVTVGAALIVNDCALFGPSIVATAEVLVVTCAFDIVPDKPYVTDGMVQLKLDVGLAAVVVVRVRLPDTMLAVPAPRPPVQLTA